MLIAADHGTDRAISTAVDSLTAVRHGADRTRTAAANVLLAAAHAVSDTGLTGCQGPGFSGCYRLNDARAAAADDLVGGKTLDIANAAAVDKLLPSQYTQG